MEIGENVSEPRIDGPDSSTRDENGVQSVKEEASSTTNPDGQSEMEIEEDNVVKYTFDESYMPLKALKLTTEQDDYRYYVHPLTQRVFSLDTAGYWYIQLEDQSYVPVEQTSLEPEKKAEAASATIVIGADGYPDFPKNEKGQPILPKSLDGKPVFPVDGSGNPMFPYDHQKKQWCFPLDEKERPIFPFNADGKPVVPVDDKGKPIFPQDTSGNFLFPVDKSNIPIPAMTVDGRSVVPYDEYGKPVIPTDKEGNPLIFMAADGVTHISKEDYIKWQAYWEEQTKLYNQQQVQSYQAPTSVFHPLNIEQATAIDWTNVEMLQRSKRIRPQAPTSVFHPLNIEQATAIDWTNVEMLQRSKRIRPEDVDLPSMDMGYSYDSPEGQMLSYHGQHQLAQQPQEDEKTLKRKKMLAAQLKFTKQLGEKKDKPAEKPVKMELSTPPKPPKIESKEVKKSSKVDTPRKREEKSTPRKRSRSPARRDRRDEPRNGRKVERSPPPPPTTKKPNWMEQARAKRVENVKNKPFKRNYSISPVRKQGQKRSRSSSSSRSRSRSRPRKHRLHPSATLAENNNLSPGKMTNLTNIPRSLTRIKSVSVALHLALVKVGAEVEVKVTVQAQVEARLVADREGKPESNQEGHQKKKCCEKSYSKKLKVIVERPQKMIRGAQNLENRHEQDQKRQKKKKQEPSNYSYHKKMVYKKKKK
uniref:Uncharacterized protein n=1 Tax=Acrobeloides nanus TaxID=290746 RepID=A0A914DLX4_9BILA